MKVKIKIDRVEKHNDVYRVRYRYADMRPDFPSYASRQYGAVDEMDALVQFKRGLDQFNYEVVTDE